MGTAIVTGLKAEADLFAPIISKQISVICGAGNDRALRQQLRELLERQKPDLIVSFGISGGLGVGLNAGTIILGEKLLTMNQSFPCDAQWSSRVKSLLPQAKPGAVYGTICMIAEQSEKVHLAKSGALALDMESLVTWHLAHEFNIPMGILRVIADPAWRTLPSAARIPLKSDGRPDLLRIILAILGDPTQIGAMLTLKKDYDLAMQQLAQIVQIDALFAIAG